MERELPSSSTDDPETSVVTTPVSIEISSGTLECLSNHRSDRDCLIASLNQNVHNCQWSEVISLATELKALEETSSVSSGRARLPSDSDADRSIISLCRSRSTSISARSVFCDRLTVFQAGPLVSEERNGTLQPLPRINFRWEKEALIKAFGDARQTVELVFDIATPDRLNAVLANAHNNPFLHVTGHGTPDGQLVLGDGFGLAKFMKREDLIKYPNVSDLFAVFVSACHSRSIGDAFINAGVKHVICCTNEAKLKDAAAIVFTSAFYRALASQRTIKEAFAIAKSRVKHASGINEPHLEVSKFLLLPEVNGDDDDYHDVQLIFKRPLVADLKEETVVRRDVIPKLLPEFMDRNVEAYHIIKGLGKADVVLLVGPKGIGKKSLATFVASYVSERNVYSNVLCWLDTEVTLKHINEEIAEIVKRKQSALLVINVDNFPSVGASDLPQELENVLKLPTPIRMLLVSVDKTWSLKFSTSVTVQTLVLEPLTYESTATLFATFCPYVNRKEKPADPMVQSVPDFLNLVFRRDLYRMHRKITNDMPLRGATLFRWLGEGIPGVIRRIAMDLSPEKYEEIIMLAKKYDVLLEKFTTRRSLENAILRTQSWKREARENGLLHKAHALSERLDELTRLRDKFPSKDQLEQECEKLTETRDSLCASSNQKNFYLYLQRISLIREQIKQEECDAEQTLEVMAENFLTPHMENEVHDLIPDAKMKKVEDSTLHHPLIPQLTVRSLAKYYIKSENPFHFYINHGPAQGFSYWNASARSAIVVASNEACTGGQGILRAVTTSGGPTLLQHVEMLPTVMDSEFGQIRCFSGDAKIVGPGTYNDLKVPFVVFAVAPWFESENEAHRLLFLAGAYRSAFELAKESKLEAVAFSLIGGSCRGGECWKETVDIGVNTIVRFDGYPELKEIHLFGFTPDEAKEVKKRSAEACDKFEHMDQLTLDD